MATCVNALAHAGVLASRDRLRAAAGDGHEVANHTLDHRYDFVRLGREGIERQIEEGADVIEAASGQRPVGFRAPGYTITDEVFDVLTELGVTYDASVFPCPAYWMAKTDRRVTSASSAMIERGGTHRGGGFA